MQTSFLQARWFNAIITLLILLSVIGFSLETIPTLSPELKEALHVMEVVIVVVFTLEYVMRIVSAPRKLAFVFSFYGIIDLLAILPFYLAFAVDLRSLRLLRLFRIIRLMKLARYTAALDRFAKAFDQSKEELFIVIVSSITLIFLAAVGIFHFEHAAQPDVFRSIFDCLWWAVSSSTTVGYGEIYPITIGGKLLTTVFLFLSIGLVAVPTGIFSSALLSVRRNEEDK